ncbi:hypothetical protein [Micromonospora cremea]|uniref:Low temperature requirement A protein (LtrA) n=1 Tax=Micromonospora cremea TaxID=709881 RepID=A0A1N5TBT9_9ACTN|nr:hypothetical protein [Micromonospora cremea]SIM45933.1 hypothetical protein SAMN04489832_0083 [Micromonospora cremea]
MGQSSEPAQTRSILRSEEDAQQASFVELFFDLVLVFALLGVVSRMVPDPFTASPTIAKQPYVRSPRPNSPACAGRADSGYGTRGSSVGPARAAIGTSVRQPEVRRAVGPTERDGLPVSRSARSAADPCT